MPEVPPQIASVADELHKCNRCGFCQTRCPVYRVTGRESSVARGHSARLRAVLDQQLPFNDALRTSISECLMCRACTAECPPAIETDRIIAAARATYTSQHQSPMQNVIFRRLLANRAQLRRLAKVLGITKRTGLASLGKLLRYFPWFRGLAEAPDLMPAPGAFLRDRLPHTSNPALKPISYFAGCALEYMTPEVGEATYQVLQAAGYALHLADNVCCGLPPYVYGDLVASARLAHRNLAAFPGTGEIVTECGSCASFLKEYPHLFEEGAPERARAEAFSGRIRDLTEFLAGVELPELRPVSGIATYHDPCHLSRYQKLVREPRALLARVPGLEYRELPEADWCCGGAGSYSVAHPDKAWPILERKMENVRRTGANLLVTACPACLMQLRYGATRFGVPVEVLHLTQLLQRALPPATT